MRRPGFLQRRRDATEVAVLGALKLGDCTALEVKTITGIKLGPVYRTLERLMKSGKVASRWNDSPRYVVYSLKEK